MIHFNETSKYLYDIINNKTDVFLKINWLQDQSKTSAHIKVRGGSERITRIIKKMLAHIKHAGSFSVYNLSKKYR